MPCCLPWCGSSMAWINPNTFDVLPYGVAWRPPGWHEWTNACNWCSTNLGEEGAVWAQNSAEMQFTNRWWFKSEQDALLFQLTWL